MPRSRTSRSCWRRPEAEVAVHILRLEHPGPRAERIASRAAAVACVRRLLGSDLGDGAIEIVLDGWGVPWAMVEGRRIPVSLSHAGGWAAAAAHPGTRLGVDIEPAHEIPLPFARYFLSPGETSALAGWPDRSTSLLAAWTIKEAVLKATGRGLAVPPSTVRIRSIGPDGHVAVTVERADVSAACWQEDGAVVAAAGAGTVELPVMSTSRGAI